MMHQMPPMRRIVCGTFDLVTSFVHHVASPILLCAMKQASLTLTRVHFTNLMYLMAIHALAFAGMTHLWVCNWRTLVFAGALFYMSVLGITAGAHRLWAHKSYKAHGFVRFVLMLWNSLAHQGSIYEWSKCHRLHHRFADTDLDPHNIHYGFLHAHLGWLLLHPTSAMQNALDKIPCDDLLQDWVVVFQQRFAAVLNPFMCFAVPICISSLLWNEDWVVAFLVPGCLRYVIALHATLLANSAVHLHGTKPYNPSLCACDSVLVALLTLGDGYQNWHHQFPQDYAASENNWQFNPTTRFIDFCAIWGLAGQRQRALHLWGQKKWVSRSRSPTMSEVRPVRFVSNQIAAVLGAE